jgi:hypothetical protein
MTPTAWIIIIGVIALCLVLFRDTHGHQFIGADRITPRLAPHVIDTTTPPPQYGERSAIPAVNSSSSDCGSYGLCGSTTSPQHTTHPRKHGHY